MNAAVPGPPRFDNSYARLPERLYSRLAPTPVSTPGLIKVNHKLAASLGLDADWLASEDGINMVAGNHVPPGAEPLAAVYAGHQFGNWNPQLGDGRAILLGEVLNIEQERYDLQLKGSGPTPYSRGGDGRAPLGPVLREYLVSEAMAVLGVPTSRSLAAVTTGEPVYREDVLPGGVLARVAKSHIRIGTMQYFASQQDTDALKVLTEHVVNRHYPDLADESNLALALLERVTSMQAKLVAHWQSLGFIHGVMNTDNMLLSGETIDYGPCAFMDTFDPETLFSSIDTMGRYAYHNQPAIAQWNLACLASALLPLLDDNQDDAVALAKASLEFFPREYEAAYHHRMAAKLGLGEAIDGDRALIDDLLLKLTEAKLDYTLTFRRLADLVYETDNNVSDLLSLPESMNAWIERWQARIDATSASRPEVQASMYRVNPAFIPRNHLIEDVIQAAVRDDNLGPFHELLDVLEQPFEYHADEKAFALPPRPEQVVRATFCGT